MTTAAAEPLEAAPFAGRGERRSELRAVGVVVAAFVVSRIVYALVGVRFDADNLHWYIHLADPDLLEHRLFETVWYLHAEPPGYSLLVGAILRWSPLPIGFSLQVVYLAAGLAIALGVYDLGRQLALGRAAAVVVAVVVACGPGVVLYENLVNYDYLVAAGLVLLVDATARWVRNGSLGALVAVVGLAAAIALTRALLHPLWFVVVVGVVLLARRPARWTWKVVAAVGVPTVLLTGAMLKNEVLFGTPQLSTLFGYNTWRVTVGTLPVKVRNQLRADGTLTAPSVPRRCTVDRPAVPVLAEPYKRGRQHYVNGNWECERRWYNALGSDAIAAAQAEPRRALDGVVGSFRLWAAPNTLYPLPSEPLPNRQRLADVDAIYRRVVLLDVVYHVASYDPSATGGPTERYHLSLTIVAATLLVCGAGVVMLARWRRRGLGASRTALLVGAFTVAWVTVVGNVFEHGENARIRFIVEPLTLVLAVAVVAALAGRASARRAGSRVEAARDSARRRARLTR